MFSSGPPSSRIRSFLPVIFPTCGASAPLLVVKRLVDPFPRCDPSAPKELSIFSDQ